MTTWFTSDHHFGHAGVIGFCNRPFQTIEEMDRRLAERWNNTIRPEDRVYVLGDVSFHPPKIGVPLLRELSGEKILVLGNHDKYSPTQYRSAGFLVVTEEMVINIAGRRVRLSHYPYYPLPEHEKVMPKHELRYPERRPARHGYEFLLCGHVHERWITNGRMINVGVDAWKYAPVSQSVIEGLMAKEGTAELPYGE